MITWHYGLVPHLAAGEALTPPLGFKELGAVGGILTIFLWFGWQVYKRESGKADQNEAEIRRLNNLIQEKYVPSLEAAGRALMESNRLLSDYRERKES